MLAGIGKDGCAVIAMLRKDLYVTGRYAAAYAGAWAVISLLCSVWMNIHSLLDAMPICALTVVLNAVSADQECRWDRFAAMSSLRPWVLVGEKYLYAYGLIAMLTALRAAGLRLAGRHGGQPLPRTILVLVLLALATALPLTYRYGRRKGGALLLALWGAAAVLILGGSFLCSPVIDLLFGWMDGIPALTLGVRLAVGLLAANVLSYALSVRFYTRRQRGWYG